MKELLSVIVPIYNVENYVKRCIESIQNQTYTNLEILLLDDGSTDLSGMILDSYKDTDYRIKVIHQKNVGVNETRKQGVRSAKGDFVTFVDADDWVEAQTFEKMMDILQENEADIVIGHVMREKNQDTLKIFDAIEKGVYDRKAIERKVIPAMMYDFEKQSRGIIGSLYGKIYKKDLIRKQMDFVSSAIVYGEDACAVYPAIATASKIVVIEEYGYHYCAREKSSTSNYNFNTLEKIHKLQETLADIFQNLGIWNVMRVQVKEYIRPLLNQAIKKIYDMEIERIEYKCPNVSNIKGKKIIIYGAGDVGRSYWYWLMNMKICIGIEWVDRDYLLINEKSGLSVLSPDIIFRNEFDYILIAIENESIAHSIREWLVEKNIAEKKILWSIPQRL